MIASYRLYVDRNLPLIERACTSKARYDSRAEARAWIRHGRRSDGSMDPYHCANCDGWHVGHRRRVH